MISNYFQPSIYSDLTAEEAVDDVIEVQLPAIKKEIIEGKLTVDNIDVFCETGVFDVEQSRKILKAGIDHGLLVNFHAEELTPLKGAEVSLFMYWFTEGFHTRRGGGLNFITKLWCGLWVTSDLRDA